MPNIRYWAGGFVSGKQPYERLKDFVASCYWQALDYAPDDNSVNASRARATFSKIKVGDKFLIKGYGGSHTLKVHFVGEVIKKDDNKFRVDLKEENVKRYHGTAPKGDGAGNWFLTLLEVKRKKDIELLFSNRLT